MEQTPDTIDLGPLYEPSAVAFNFETPGWYVLFGLLLMFFLILIIKASINYYRSAYRRQALVLLNTIESRYNNKQEVACINDTMVLLKQVSLTTFNRVDVADLNGNLWLKFLDSKTKHSSFLSFEEVFKNALYQNKLEEPEAAKEVFTNAKYWIKHHA